MIVDRFRSHLCSGGKRCSAIESIHVDDLASMTLGNLSLSEHDGAVFCEVLKRLSPCAFSSVRMDPLVCLLAPVYTRCRHRGKLFADSLSPYTISHQA